MRKLRGVLVLVLFAAIISLSLAGCKSHGDHPSKEHPKQEHPSSEHPK